MHHGQEQEVTRNAFRGFTLMELMITLAIVAIIASVAVPSYTSYTRKARRADAKVALEIARSRAEKYFLNNGSYPAATSPGAAALGLMNIAVLSERGYYDIRYNYDNTAPLSAANPYFRAVARVGQPQENDTDCKTFQVGLDGTRSAFSTGNVNKTATCWD